MSHHPYQEQWDAALRAEFSACVAQCHAARRALAERDPWNRCTVFIEGLLRTQPERIAALDRDDMTTLLLSGSQDAKVAAMKALEHAATVSSPDA